MNQKFKRLVDRLSRKGRRARFQPVVECLEGRDLPNAAPLLELSSNGRFFVDSSNHPFYLVGDTAWALPAGLTVAQATSYFQTRASEGYNTVLMDADVELGASPVGAPTRGPLDANGNPPFDAFLPGTNLYDVSKPDAAYWKNIDGIINAASQNGIEIMLDVYDNYNPWFGGGTSPNSIANLTAYGQFLGQRYAGFDNIIWMVGNDYTENSGGDASLGAVIQGIRQFDTRHLGFAMDEFGATFDNTGLRSDLQINSVYEYSTGPWRSIYLSQYNRPDFGPIFNVESGYENNTSIGMTEADLRDEHYSFLLAGATGDMYGNEFVWPFADSWQSWQNALTSEGAHEMTDLANLVNSIPWYNLTPDQNGTVFQGVGSPTDYSGAYTADGTLALAYQPSTGTGSQSFTVNMSKFVGSVTAQWYDPTSGTYTSIGTFANSGSHTFNSPSTNSAGANDFVLVLRAAATAPATPTGVTATPGNNQVTLTWNASPGAATYNIYRSTSPGAEGNTPYMTNVATTFFTDTGLTNGMKYYYRVSAVNSVGESTESSEVSATPELLPPPIPIDVTATAANTQVSLSWTASSGASTYNIYRSTSSNGEGATPIKTGVTGTSFTDTGLTDGTTYYYEVTAVNTAGESGKSSEVSATPNAVWTYVQTVAGQTAATTNAEAFNAATNSGDLIVVEVDWSSSVNFTSIKDSQGNTFVEIGGEQNSSNFGAKSRLYYATNIKGGADTITSTLSGTPGFQELWVSEYSGLNKTSPLDAFSVNVGTGSTFTSNNLTTTAAGDLLYGIEIDSATSSAAAGWMTRSTLDSNVEADQTASSTGSYAFTGSSSGGSIAWIAAFKLAGGTANTPPTITSTASASPNPVGGKTTNLSGQASDSDGDPLTYTWAETSGPSGVTFSANGTGTANNTTATFTQAGAYTFQVTATDSAGLTATSSVNVTVNQTLTSITVSPATATVADSGKQQFSATAKDQFGHALTTQPAITWSLASGGLGAISSSGLYTAPTTGTGSATVQAVSGSLTGTASVTVTASSAPPTFVRASANQTQAASNAVTMNSSSGDTIIVEVDFSSSVNFTSLSDNQGNTYVEIGTQQISASFGASSRLYYATNIKGGSLTVSSMLSGVPGFHELYVNEYSGINPSSPLDGFSVHVATGSSFTSNNVTTTAANDLLFGIEIDVASASAAAGWTARSTYDSNIDADRTASTAGSYAFTGSSSGSYMAWIVAFKDGSPSATAPTITTQPNSASITAGQAAKLTVAASGTAPLSYQWQKMVSGSWTAVANSGDITGATTATLAFSAGVAADAGQYRVVVTNSAGSATSSTATLTVNPAANATMGETAIMPSDDNGNANLLLAQQTTLNQAGTLQSLSFYVTQAAGSLVLGVYDASGPNGGPGKLLAQTNSFTPVVGWNTAPVTSPVQLAAGTYWLAYLPSSDNLHFRVDRTSGSIAWYSSAFGPMPGSFSTSPNTQTAHWSFYATLTTAL